MDAQLKIRTEFHFSFADKVYGPIDRVIDSLPPGTRAAGIGDNTSFAHIAWHRKCSAKGIKPLLGIELRARREDAGEVSIATVIARNLSGLYELYALASSEPLTEEALLQSSPDVIKIAHNFGPPIGRADWFTDLSPRFPTRPVKQNTVLISDNYYPKPEDRGVYELFGGAVRMAPVQFQHIMRSVDQRSFFRKHDAAALLAAQIADTIDCPLPRAPMIRIDGDLEAICRAGIAERGYSEKWTAAYENRLVRELGLIREKNYEAYFLVISDMVRWAKRRMLVGPARGSAAGSLVCFLAFITDIDPLLYDLIFERFIDITRIDLPDIDLDFPDERRAEVIEYLTGKYGAENVAHIGTVLTWQPRSILTEFSKKLNIPPWELKKLKDAMIVRSTGDSRAANCMLDTLETMDVGKEILQKYGNIRLAAAFEGHAKYSGTHAAGIIVCNEPIRKYATIKGEDRVAQIDKQDAEKVGLLKIDVLGLRTLSVMEDALREIGEPIDMLRIPLDDPAAFAILNEGRFAGIFQFEGDAVQMLTKRMRIETFADVAALGALARPGPLSSGGATLYTDRRTGRAPVEHLHPLLVPYTAETMGIIVYQEQVMTIGRDIGDLDWEDVTQLRKAMSKSLGEEFFNTYWEKFYRGAARKHKLTKLQARHIWDNMSTMGSWAFNKSHAVSYGLLSYWCCWLKAHHPLAFAAATLRNTKGDEQVIQVLRELLREGIDYVAFDPQLSVVDWAVREGKLVGGFLNLKGFGDVKARKFVEKRSNGGWTPKEAATVAAAERLYAVVNPAQQYFGKLYDDPRHNGFPGIRKIYQIAEVLRNDDISSFAFIGCLVQKKPRDLNEYQFQVKRVQEGKEQFLTGDTQYLRLIVEDDSGKAWCTIGRRVYDEIGKPIVNNGVEGKSWYLITGSRDGGTGYLRVSWVKELKVPT